ncbi:hypothetical protein ATANTOWER_012440 [Ataeniobius toweri]|uniref:C2H2-type domain-containing protein n=1 Tax=Ataeniobius toweri TaxID=208326 RepID=A0ABU7BPU8_9TELE|nr:hypothetical protein [Ataeniobius toweri]
MEETFTLLNVIYDEGASNFDGRKLDQPTHSEERQGHDDNRTNEESISTLHNQLLDAKTKVRVCYQCGKCFSKSRMFKIHRRFPTGEPYSCDHGGKSFTKKVNITGHQRIHTGIKAYRCDYRGKGFTHKGNLVAHQHSHTREKSFTCNQCRKCYIHMRSLLHHQRSHQH